MPVLKDIEYTRGDSEPITITIKDSDGNLIDLTGMTFLMTVSSKKEPTASEAAAAQLFQVVGALDADPTTGKVSFTPSSVQTDAVGTYYYDIQRTDSGKIKTYIKGNRFKLEQDITKN